MSHSFSRSVLLIDFLQEDAPQYREFKIENLFLQVHEHKIGLNFSTAQQLIQKYDGLVDGICLSGIRLKFGFGDTLISFDKSRELKNSVQKSKVFFGEDILSLFAEITLQRMAENSPEMFLGKKALFHLAASSAFLPVLEMVGAKVSSADMLVFKKMGHLLTGSNQIQNYLLLSQKLISWVGSNPLFFNFPTTDGLYSKSNKKLLKWVSSADLFFSYNRILVPLLKAPRETLEQAFNNKVLFIDFISADDKTLLKSCGVKLIVEFNPQNCTAQSAGEIKSSLWAAIFEFMRVHKDPALDASKFFAQKAEALLSQTQLAVLSPQESTRKCVFFIHPLHQDDFLKAFPGNLLAHAPSTLKDIYEKTISHTPSFFYGSIHGIQSESTGQKVVCELYVVPSTPKMLKNANPHRINAQILKGIEESHQRGSLIAGLGAYLKVIGDAGVSIARQSPIPVTTGNSFTVATTLWAARVLVEKMNILPMAADGKKVLGQAMVIGATGSIGRVAALLLAHVFEEIVLVGLRKDRLEEIAKEIAVRTPLTKVKILTESLSELPQTDLIVTATSKIQGQVLDISKVKPGAIICDASRPLNISAAEAAQRPDILVMQSGEVLLPGKLKISCDIGLPKPAVYACLAETVLLALDGKYECFSLSRDLSFEKVKEIYKIGVKHGAKLDIIRGMNGPITDEQIELCRKLAIKKLEAWPQAKARQAKSLAVKLKKARPASKPVKAKVVRTRVAKAKPILAYEPQSHALPE